MPEAQWRDLVSETQENKSVCGCLRYGQDRRWVIKVRGGITNKRPGPKVVIAYEREVWGEMLLISVEEITKANGDKETVGFPVHKVIQNVCYSAHAHTTYTRVIHKYIYTYTGT